MKNDFSLPGKGMVSVVLLHIIIKNAMVYSLPGSSVAPAGPLLMLTAPKKIKETIKLPLPTDEHVQSSTKKNNRVCKR